MKAADVLFLVCVTAVAALFVAAALSHTETAATPPAVPARPAQPAVRATSTSSASAK